MRLEELIARVIPGAVLEETRELKPDVTAEEAVLKASGYGKPLLLKVRDGSGQQQRLVFHTAGANAFGHDRRADRAAEMLLAYDTFHKIPQHTQALDVGAIRADGAELLSLGDAGEFYLLSSYAEGHVYAEELRDIARRGSLLETDLQHTQKLAEYLARLHSQPLQDDVAYQRSVRDLVGSGEGIFGIIDGYPKDISAAVLGQLRQIEALAVSWRWKLKSLKERLTTTHGDFHPFNLIFNASGELSLLDASRGCQGDAADDVSCLAINYVFFALDQPGAWQASFRQLWQLFWQTYLERSGSRQVLDTLAPYLAWRGLVLANPTWYAGLTDVARRKLLGFVQRALESQSFDPDFADSLFIEDSDGARPTGTPAGGFGTVEVRGNDIHGALATGTSAGGLRPGTVIWFTGPPSSGKSTLARKVHQYLTASGRACCVLDGDDVRAAVKPGWGYDAESRDAFYESLGQLALILAEQGTITLVAATANRRRYRDAVRRQVQRFIEVFVDTPSSVCQERDAKGLYAAQRAHQLKGVPGGDADYEAPLAPELRATPATSHTTPAALALLL